MASRTSLRGGLAAAVALGGCHLIGGAGELEFEGESGAGAGGDTSTGMAGAGPGGGEGAGGGTGGASGGGGATPAACGNGVFESGDLCFDLGSPAQVNTGIRLQDLVVLTCNEQQPAGTTLPSIVVVGREAAPPSSLMITAFPNLGDRLFDQGEELTVATQATAVRMVTGQLTGDAEADLAVALTEDPSTNDPMLRRFEGQGDCAFAPTSPSSHVLPAAPHGLATIDFDEMAPLDLIVSLNKADPQDPDVEWLTSEQVSDNANHTLVDTPLGAATGNFGGDPADDVVFVDVINGDVVLRVRQSNGFGLPKQVSVGTQPFDLAVLDLEGDGPDDLVVANLGDNTLSVLAGDGAGGLIAQAPIATTRAGLGAEPIRVVVADVDGDGLDDIVTLNRGSNDDPSLGLFINDRAGSFEQPEGFPMATPALPRSVAVADLDGDQAPEIVYITGDQGDTFNDIWVLWANP